MTPQGISEENDDGQIMWTILVITTAVMSGIILISCIVVYLFCLYIRYNRIMKEKYKSQQTMQTQTEDYGETHDEDYLRMERPPYINSKIEMEYGYPDRNLRIPRP